jgi:hypothetical protein
MLYARAIRAILARQQAIEDILAQRKRDPSKVSDKDFFRECAWAIYVAGFRVETVRKKLPELGQAFFHWDYQQVCSNITGVRDAARRAINRHDKADAVIQIAQWMCQTGWESIRRRLLEGLTQDTQGNIVPDPELITYLDNLPMIGEVSAIFILKNLGYDMAKPDTWLRKLAAKFDYPADKDGVQQFASDISQLTFERISVVETVLWNASSSKADLIFKCPHCGRQR